MADGQAAGVEPVKVATDVLVAILAAPTFEHACAEWRLANPGATWPLDAFKAGWIAAGGYPPSTEHPALEAINGRLA